jgi:hypothetical protein
MSKSQKRLVSHSVEVTGDMSSSGPAALLPREQVKLSCCELGSHAEVNLSHPACVEQSTMGWRQQAELQLCREGLGWDGQV